MIRQPRGVRVASLKTSSERGGLVRAWENASTATIVRMRRGSGEFGTGSSTLSAFGVLALVLSATGIYGVMAYAVSRRTREIGIRMAIGATQAQVLASVARRAATLIGAGLVVGLGEALIAGQLLERILYGVKPNDPLTFAMVFAMMLGIGALATFLPARRAARIDPMKALRQE